MASIIRQARKSPGFFAAAVVTLALGIGSNAAMFSVVYAVLLKPMPFDEPDRLVSVQNTAPGIGWKKCPLAAATYFTYRDENRAFEDIAAWSPGQATVTGGDEPERIRILRVTDGFLPVLRVEPMLGRRFTSEDTAPGGPLRVILTYGYWQRRFGGDRQIVGRTITLDGQPREIIGVLPKAAAFAEPFASPERPRELLAPFQFDRATTTIANFGFMGVARLKRGISVEAANRDIARMIPLTAQKFPAEPSLGATFFNDMRLGPNVRPLSEEVTGDLGRVLWVLMGTMAMVFLIACANVANLFLVRAESRQQELAVRSALGASRSALARSLLSESLALGLVGGVVGAGVAEVAVRVVRATAPAALPRIGDITLGPVVLIFVALLSVAAGLLFGLIPVLKFSAPRLSALKQAGRGGSDSRERHRTRSVLVVVEIALALVLLVGSGLMLRTFHALGRVNPGVVNPEQVLTFQLTIPRSLARDPEQTIRREFELASRLREVPGVRAVGMGSGVPMDGARNGNPMLVEEFPLPGNQSPLSRWMKWIAPGYFETMGIPLVAGRYMSWNDVFSYAPVVIINEQLARAYWKNPADAVGKRMRESNQSPWRVIIGVVANTREDGLAQEAPGFMYWPALTKNWFGEETNAVATLTYAVRSTRVGSPEFLNDVRKAVWSIDRNMPLANVRTLDFFMTQSKVQTTFALVMLLIASGVALLLGVVGIYGVIGYITAQRTREIGIRMALGAQPRDVALLFMRHGVMLSTAGIAIGAVVAMTLSRLMNSLLFGVTSKDPATYLAVSVLLAVVVVVAGYVPSRRASRMAPVTALRSDT